MSQLAQGSLTVLNGEEAAREQAEDLRLYSQELNEEGAPEGAAVPISSVISFVTGTINAIKGVASLVSGPADSQRPSQPEAEDEVTLMLGNSSGLSLVPVRNEKVTGSVDVAAPGDAVGAGERTRLVAKTKGLATSSVRTKLLIDDTDQHSVVELVLTKVPGEGEGRGWRFSGVKLPDAEEIQLPATGNRELVGLVFEAGRGELGYALYLRGCEAATGLASIELYDRTDRVAEPEDVVVVTGRSFSPKGQLVRITSKDRGTGDKRRYLRVVSGKDPLVVRATTSPGQSDLWLMKLFSNGSVSLQHVESQKFIKLDSRNQLLLSTGSSGSAWRLNTSGSAADAFALQFKNKNRFLRVGGGDSSSVSLANAVRASRWFLEPVSETSLDVAEGASEAEILAKVAATSTQIFRIRARAKAQDGTGLFVEQFDAEPNARIRSEVPQDARQIWTVSFQKSGYVLVQNVGTQKFLANIGDRELLAADAGAGASRLWRIQTNDGLKQFALQSVNGGNINLVGIQPGDPDGQRDKINVAPPSASDRQQWSLAEL